MSILDRFRVDGRTAIVTGASSGLGVDFARALAEAGANVAVAGRRADRLDKTRRLVEQTGRSALAVRTDVSRPEDCQSLVDATMERFGRLDILVNNAAIATAVPATRETPEQFREVIEINLNGSYWMAQASARAMQPGSAIVNVSSVVAQTTGGLPQAAYAASKAGLLGLTRDLALQWTQRRGIRVNALLPGYFATEMTGQSAEGHIDYLLSRAIAGRPGTGEEIATALLFLASDAGAYVTGVALPVDGGIHIT